MKGKIGIIMIETKKLLEYQETNFNYENIIRNYNYFTFYRYKRKDLDSHLGRYPLNSCIRRE